MSSIIIQKVQNSLFDSCTYVLNIGTSVYWLVDCGDVVPLMPIIEGKQLGGVLLTHAHFDHIYGLNELLSRCPETFVYTNKSGAEALMDDKKNLSRYHETPFVFEYPESLRIVDDGDEIILYNGITTKVLATPGHHPSCLTYIIGNAIFTGDSYIPGIEVVTKLPKGDIKQAQESLYKIIQLANERTIYPGHYTDY